MDNNALDILKRLTKPKSEMEMDQLLIARHGSTGRGNASADITALDEPARQSLIAHKNKSKPRVA